MSEVTDGLRWIGEHSHEEKRLATGMLGGISLTVARGVEAEDFLVRLGADSEQLQRHDLYNERYELAAPAGLNVSHAMYGTCGDWLYILEDDFRGFATWWAGYRTVAAMAPLVGEEIICLTQNRHDAPSLILHAPGDGQTWEAEFKGETERSSGLDAALHAAGAVFPSFYAGTASSTEEESRYFEEHLHELQPAVFAAVGNYCGITIGRDSVEAGDLPLVLVPSLF